MSRKLAIKGHPTRGKEVIELLETMGGKNIYKLLGSDRYAYYVIEGRQNEIRAGEYIFDDKDMCFFTLEEFLKKYPHKVGDKVIDCYGNSLIIKSMSWSTDCETMVYDFEDSVIVLAAEDIRFAYDNTNPSKMKNVLAELLEHIKTTPKEELEREFEEIKEWSNVGPTVEEFRTFCEYVNKKPVYPKTFEECLNMLYCKSILKTIIGHKAELLLNLEKLLICRDAYWKIAGEEMELDKPWEPDWNGHEFKYGLKFMGHRIEKTSEMTVSHVLCFPTEEMRDAFYENFKDLIEQCKELL